MLIGIAFFRWPRSTVPWTAFAAGCCLAGLAILSALSIAWASDNGRAYADAVRVAAYLGLFVLVVITAGSTGARAWLNGLAIGLACVAVLALGSRLEPNLFPKQELGLFLPAAGSRLSYPLNYWNGLAACMAAAIVLLAWLGAHARSLPGRATATALLPVPGLALYLTSSRGGVLAAAVGLTVLLAVGTRRLSILAGLLVGGGGTGFLIALTHARGDLLDGLSTAAAHRQGDEILIATIFVIVALAIVRLLLDRLLAVIKLPRWATAATWLAAALALAVGIVAVNPSRRLDRFNDPPGAVTRHDFVSSHLASSVGSGRYQLWDAALDAFRQHPVRGIGAGGYEAWWTRHGSIAYYVRDAHSLVLQMASELGVPGVALLLGFLAVPFLAGLRRRSGDERAPPVQAALGLLAGGVVSASLDWTWQLPAAAVSLVIAAGVLSGPRTGSPAPSAPQTRSRFGWGVAVLVVGWIAICASGVLLASNVLVNRSQAQVRDGDLPAAADSAREARSIEPWSAAPRLQLALVEELRGDLEAAKSAASEAAERADQDWRIWLVIARLRTKSGDVRGARVALRRVRELNPRSPIFAGGGNR